MCQPTLCHYRLKVSSVHQLGFHLCRHCNHRLRVGWNTHQPSLIVECNTCSRRPPYESRSHFNVAPRNYDSSTGVEESSFPEKKSNSIGNYPSPYQAHRGQPQGPQRKAQISFCIIKNQIFWLPLSKQQASLAPLWLFSNCVQQNEPRLELVTRLPALCCWSPCSASSSSSSSSS